MLMIVFVWDESETLFTVGLDLSFMLRFMSRRTGEMMHHCYHVYDS